MASVRAVKSMSANECKIHGEAAHIDKCGCVETELQAMIRSLEHRLADQVTMTVADSGPGFTPEDRRRLFQPFARLSARPTGGEHSSGLGLYLVRRLVNELAGELHCESEPGRGARMIVSLAATE